MPVVFSNTGGSLPGNVSANTIYYVGGLDTRTANTFYISTNLNDALHIANDVARGLSIASECIQYSSAGSGTNTYTIAPAGVSTGEYSHTQLLGEIAQHNHTATITTHQADTTNSGAHTGVGYSTATNAQSSTDISIANTGNNVPFNIVQPYTLMNFFIKL